MNKTQLNRMYEYILQHNKIYNGSLIREITDLLDKDDFLYIVEKVINSTKDDKWNTNIDKWIAWSNERRKLKNLDLI